jgi:excisionase family DNA binding protein
VSIPEASRLTGIGNTKLYQLIGDGVVETTAIGKRRLVIYKSLEALVNSGRSMPSDTPANWTPPAPRRRRAA